MLSTRYINIRSLPKEEESSSSYRVEMLTHLKHNNSFDGLKQSQDRSRKLHICGKPFATPWPLETKSYFSTWPECFCLALRSTNLLHTIYRLNNSFCNSSQCIFSLSSWLLCKSHSSWLTVQFLFTRFLLVPSKRKHLQYRLLYESCFSHSVWCIGQSMIRYNRGLYCMLSTGHKDQEGFTKGEVISVSTIRHVYSTSSVVFLSVWHFLNVLLYAD